MQDIFLEKYDKKLATVYQNYYRAKDLDEDELTGSELTYSEYADWRDEAMDLRKNYISERITEKIALYLDSGYIFQRFYCLLPIFFISKYHPVL